MRKWLLLCLFPPVLCLEAKRGSQVFENAIYQEKYAVYIHLYKNRITLVDEVSCVSFFLQLFIRHHEMLEKTTTLATHVLDQIL